MSERSVWPYLRNLTTILSLANVVSAYAEKTVSGTRSITAILDDPTVRTRFWITAVLLGLTGLLALVYLVRSTGDMAGDLGDGVIRQRIIALAFGAGQVLLAIGLATLLMLVP
ncbi:hypothetical protein [Plantactinospora endophytica]|uniref:Fe/B12 periplasmic-binding domain-containing protein n=1 Tax=Plantactinospora endophytica TaxID=673535 RepID=A0ABQ4EBV1_9ACTN|nr:hypothetical protein [Plantactinospora endophytica]GIG92215.1 hypothetical protein Pen02_71510 [Plantactinospora endophytica]